MIIIDEHAHISAEPNGGYELCVDTYVNTTEVVEGKRQITGKTIKRATVGYYATFASALNGYVETNLKDLAADEAEHDLTTVISLVQDPKKTITQKYQEHYDHKS